MDRRLGVRDQHKMDEYLTSVREVEQRIERSEKWLDVPKPEVPEASLNLDIEATVPVEYMNTMFDLLVLIFRQIDSTRVGIPDCRRKFDGTRGQLPWRLESRKPPRSIA